MVNSGVNETEVVPPGVLSVRREFYYLDIAVDLDPGEEKLLAYFKSELKLPRRED